MTATQAQARGPYTVRAHGERWAICGPAGEYSVVDDFGSALTSCEALNKEHAMRNGGEYEPLSRVELIDHGRELCRLAGARAVGYPRSMIGSGELSGPMVDGAQEIVEQYEQGMRYREKGTK